MNLSLVEYYKNLLIMQCRDKTKARGHIGNILSAGMIYDIAIAVRDGFDLDTARGAQLDVLGRILGVSRTITGTTFTRAYYGYMLYGDTAPFTFNPMLLYGAETGDVQFRNYKEGQQSLYDLTDEEYRVILKLAIVRNNSNASVKTIDEILFNLFGSDCYFIDRMNMTVVSYMVGEKWSRIFGIAKSTGLLPNPAGVGTSVVVVPDINSIFSFSLYGGAAPDFAVGFALYPGVYDFIAIGEASRDWSGITTDSEGDLWATVSGGDIYKCLKGTTTFIGIGEASRNWRGITTDSEGDLWATTYGGDIYKCLFGETTFIGIGEASRNWSGITTDSEGDLWATVSGGDIYKCLKGTTTFIGIGEASRNWRGITTDSEGDLWAVDNGGDIYKCLKGTTTFIGIGEASRDWSGITTDSEGNLWATTYGGDIYKCLFGETTFIGIGEASRNWSGITTDSEGDLWAVDNGGDIYKANFVDGTIGCMASYS